MTMAEEAEKAHEEGMVVSINTLPMNFGARWDGRLRRWQFPDGSVGIF